MELPRRPNLDILNGSMGQSTSQPPKGTGGMTVSLMEKQLRVKRGPHQIHNLHKATQARPLLWRQANLVLVLNSSECRLQVIHLWSRDNEHLSALILLQRPCCLLSQSTPMDLPSEGRFRATFPMLSTVSVITTTEYRQTLVTRGFSSEDPS